MIYDPSTPQAEIPLRDLRGAIRIEEPKRSIWRSASCAASSRRSLIILVLGLLILVGAAVTQAQDSTPVITDDQVNAVARKMFCPVCENEPLDVCMTEACRRWREDIRGQLASGRTEDQIIADFVARYGERASSTPLDPTLRGLSVYVPWLIAGTALLIGVLVFWRWRLAKRPAPAVPTEGSSEPTAPGDDADAAYRATFERDLKE
ncbi:MAG: cytochrome c-type biogenesis protein CcmH [Anaerolineae bacterium]